MDFAEPGGPEPKSQALQYVDFVERRSQLESATFFKAKLLRLFFYCSRLANRVKSKNPDSWL